MIAVIQGIFFLEETNPRPTPTESAIEDSDVDEATPILRRSARRTERASRTSFSKTRTESIVDSLREVRRKASFLEEGLPGPIEQRFDLRRSSFGTVHSIRLPHELRQTISDQAPPSALPRRTFNFTVIMLTISIVLISYHQMAFGAIVPVYLLDTPAKPTGQLDLMGGLGYTVHDVGTFMAINGVIAMAVQALIFPVFVERVGVWKSFVLMVLVYPIAYLIMPFLSVLPSNWTGAGVYFTMFLQNFFGIIVVPCILILLKNATPSPAVLGKVNGLAMSACCGARTFSPPLVGIFYSAGGSAAAWFSCAAVAVIGIVQLFWVPREPMGEVHVEPVFAHKAESPQMRPRRVSDLSDVFHD